MLRWRTCVLLLVCLFTLSLISTQIALAQESTCDSSIRYMDVGYQYYSNEDYTQALAAYSCAVALMPNEALPYHWRGNAYRNLGEYEESIQDYDRALEIDPNLAFTYNNRGWSYYKLGNNEQAVADFRKALELDPDLVYAM